MPTIFQVRDARLGETTFRTVMRETYKRMITIHDRSGQPIRVETVIRDGIPHKQLTLMEDKHVRRAIG